MTREEVLQFTGLKKRFCKDCNLPINLFDEPYFTQRLKALDVQFDCVKKFDTFCADLEKYDTEQEYFEYYNTVKDSVINMIKDNTEYMKFLNDDFADVRVVTKNITLGNKNLYIEGNQDKTFISIDMKKANFSALRHYSPAIFKNVETWEQYIGFFTPSEHIRNSKYIRQVILGACNPKRQITYERYLMTMLYLHIKNELDGKVSFYSLGNDEIIISVAGTSVSAKEIKAAIATCPQKIGELVRFEMFDLQKVGDYGWMKVIYDEPERVEFKTINADIYHQIVKHYWNLPITEDDLVFRYNGVLARFLEGVKNPWT
jgi:hypothetical protein